MLTLITLFLASFAGIFAYFLTEGTRQTATTLEDRSAAAAQVVATNAAWISEVARQTLRRVDASLGASLSGPRDNLQIAIEDLPPSTEIYVVDANANTIFSTVPGASDVSILDRAYFTEVRDGALFHVSSLLTSRLTEDQIFVFSKRIERDGAFAGAAMISFPVSMLSAFWASLDLPAGSTISLVRTDGMLIARHPVPDAPVDLAQHPLFTEHLPKQPVGTYFSETSPLDGVSRVVSYRLIGGSEIVALAAITTGEAWSRFNRAIVAVFLIVSPIIIGLVAGSIWTARLLFRDARRKSELEDALEANKLLFREIHHRVKNNLQSVQSLVALQNIPPDAKRDLGARLAAMAAMHEHIYQSDRYAEIDAHDYVPVIMNEVAHAYGQKCSMVYDVDHLAIDRDHATPFALLLSELATNACKYAFSDGREGELRVSAKANGTGRADILVSDNGVGLSETRTAGMGTRLIEGLVSQMGGTYTLTSDGGAHFKANLALESAGHDRAAQARNGENAMAQANP
jgi:two-component sensor histidine kinase